MATVERPITPFRLFLNHTPADGERYTVLDYAFLASLYIHPHDPELSVAAFVTNTGSRFVIALQMFDYLMSMNPDLWEEVTLDIRHGIVL